MKMTEQDIRETISKLNLTESEKKKMQSECDKGNPNALFAIRGTWLRNRNK